MKYTILTPHGGWLQNHIGDEATVRARAARLCEVNHYDHVVVLDEIADVRPDLSHHTQRLVEGRRLS